MQRQVVIALAASMLLCIVLVGCGGSHILGPNSSAMHGRVLDNNGLPLVGVEIKVTRTGYETVEGETTATTEVVGTCNTDGDGRFAIYVPIGYKQVTLTFTKTGLTCPPLFFQDSLDLPTSEIRVQMAGAPTLSNPLVIPARGSQTDSTPIRLAVTVTDNDAVADVKAVFLDADLASVRTIILTPDSQIMPQVFTGGAELTASQFARGTYTVRFTAVDTDGLVSNVALGSCVIGL